MHFPCKKFSVRAAPPGAKCQRAAADRKTTASGSSFTLKDIVLVYFQQNRQRRAKHMITIEISAKSVAVCCTTKTTQLHRHLEAVIKVDMRCLNVKSEDQLLR
jgi:hypothetical protein